MCVTSSCFIKECNKVNIASAHCSALACRTAAVDNDRKRWWLTQWKNKGTCYCMQLLPGLHQWQHREYAMYLVTYHQTHASPFLETALSSSKTKLHTYLFHVQQSGHRTSCTCAHSDTIMLHRLLSELRLSINIVSRVDDDGPTTIRFLKQSPVFALYRCVVVTS